jgi:hypothetical protein
MLVLFLRKRLNAPQIAQDKEADAQQGGRRSTMTGAGDSRTQKMVATLSLLRLSARLLLIKEQSQLHSESLGDMPQRHDSGISLAQFEAANIGPIDSHPLGKLCLGQTGRVSQPPHVPPHHAPHVLGHARSRSGCVINCDAL